MGRGAWVLVAMGVASCARHPRPHPHATTSAAIDLAVGQAVSIPTEGLREYGVDGQEVVGVHRTKDALVLSALRPGTTAIYLVDADGKVARREIRVAVPRPRTRGEELADELSTFRCLRVVRADGGWSIEATPLEDAERLELEEMKEGYAAEGVELRIVPRACAAAPLPDAAAAVDAGVDDAGPDVDADASSAP